MKVKITRDQAVWERETFSVEIPDGTPEDEVYEALLDAVDNFQGHAEDGYTKEVLDEAVYGISTQTVFELTDGKIIGGNA